MTSLTRGTAVHPDLVLMLLADARLPVAGHTQSATLEGALAHGLPPGDVPAYLVTRLQTVTRTEAACAVVARARAISGGALDEVERAWEARTPSAALRETSHGQARALLRLAVRLWPDATAGLAELRPSRATALGALAARLGLGAAGLARLVGYDDVQTVCAAALKLAPCDPAVVAGWVCAALPGVDALAAEVAPLVSPEQIPALGCPQIEEWAQLHAVTTRRLFRA